MMTESRFTHLLDAFGPDLDRWPEDERDGAREALASSATLSRMCVEAQALDDALAMPSIYPSADLRERVIASAVTAGLRDRSQRNRWFALWSGAGVVATAAAGIVLGFMLAHHMNAPVYAETVYYQAALQGADDTEMLGMEMAALETKH